MATLLIVLGWLAWAVAFFVLLVQAGCSLSTKDPGVRMMAGRYSFVLLIGMAVTIFTSFSKLHLLWWMPVAYFLNYQFLSFTVDRKMDRTMEKILSEPSKVVPRDKTDGPR